MTTFWSRGNFIKIYRELVRGAVSLATGYGRGKLYGYGKTSSVFTVRKDFKSLKACLSSVEKQAMVVLYLS